ncbi:MAG: peptidylprolyl isomerase [Firmicutes bacterium]|nr:peptidylprolyl isomerase [Bacillota bacterium]MCM1401757.1 peptidylprolyl isomerase [Bacteroides sp.]MCM1476902.1 peptidylprolyl isomerase [Bacteroides sp.]
MNINRYILATLFSAVAFCMSAQNNVAEEVAWVVGDQPIWKSEIEEQYNNMQYEKVPITGDPYCFIPEQIAIEKLYLHQAELDTVEVPNASVVAEVDARLNFYITQLGSKEKMEQYFRKSMPEMRESMMDMVRNSYKVRQVQQSLTKDVKATPSDVRKYFDKLPADSVPFVPTQVEVQILTLNPVIPRQEIEDVKARLRDMADKVNKGESEFSTLAILYSEDKESAVRGGEIGFMGRGHLDPEYAAVAFNLNDPKRVSKIVESQYGFHIIQLIEKRGDRINTRHILLRPKVSDNDLTKAVNRLDSIRKDMVDEKKFTFEEATMYVSQDKDTRNNRGVMVNQMTGTPRFEMAQLPQEVAKKVNTMQPGDISEPFVMIDPKLNREVVALVKLSNRIPAHKANITDDYQTIKDMYEDSRRQEILKEWLDKKIKDTYVRIEDGWRNCDFIHKGWIKAQASSNTYEAGEKTE